MAIRLEPKRANEVRDYRHDWTPFLGSDTIASQTTTATGATVDSAAVETGNRSILFWVSGGTNGSTATITQTVVTAAGRTETETFVLQVADDEVVTLAQAKDYLGELSSDRDAKIAAMIPRARLWVEDHTGLSLLRRQFTERHLPKYGAIRLFKGPLVTVDEIAYTDDAGAQTYTGRNFPPDPTIFPAADDSWPTLSDNNQFEVTYTAGYSPADVDDRLVGAMLALIEGEFSEGYAYPPRAVEAAERCCGQLRMATV